MSTAAARIASSASGEGPNGLSLVLSFTRLAMRLEQGFRIIMTAPVRSTPGLVEGRRLAAR